MIQPITATQRLISLCSLLGVLWLNFAYVEHQYDFHPEHHSQHQCQLFSAVANGLTHAMPTGLDQVLLSSAPLFYITATIVVPFHAYLARSPPFQLISYY
ncbi:DUF2607 domain-containing protein [Vibrio kyushuensis]|uniref:DUF2607 family protein n=1 Tax=Vibrio TaxID=662 RepID=UPI003D13DD77